MPQDSIVSVCSLLCLEQGLAQRRCSVNKQKHPGCQSFLSNSLWSLSGLRSGAVRWLVCIIFHSKQHSVLIKKTEPCHHVYWVNRFETPWNPESKDEQGPRGLPAPQCQAFKQVVFPRLSPPFHRMLTGPEQDFSGRRETGRLEDGKLWLDMGNASESLPGGGIITPSLEGLGL